MLKVQDVEKTYAGNGRQVRALDGVSLTVAAGEAVAIQGPSGCGKSTLLLACGALLRPSGGTIWIGDSDPYQLSADQRSRFRAQHVGFVFQQFHLVPYLDVLQNILAANVPHPQAQPVERAEELIRHFGLEDRRRHVPAELSVGERQRVALARALFQRPRLVLADEPTGNLDPDNAVIVLDALRDYAAAGAAVLMVTHDPHAAQRAQRVLQMERGRLVSNSQA
jgi:ABC-type lipoprotein export system ATPase subunit